MRKVFVIYNSQFWLSIQIHFLHENLCYSHANALSSTNSKFILNSIKLPNGNMEFQMKLTENHLDNFQKLGIIAI